MFALFGCAQLNKTDGNIKQFLVSTEASTKFGVLNIFN